MAGVLLLNVSFTPASAEDSTTINLGGPRKAIVAIRETEENYRITVTMIPVRSFDPGMNRQLSQKKARFYAIEALHQYLKVDAKRGVTVSGVEVGEAGTFNERFVMSYNISRKNIAIADKEVTMSDSILKIEARRGSLIRSKSDFLHTLEIIVESLAKNSQIAESDTDSVFDAISDLEELGVNRFAALCEEIRADRWLLSTDRDELLLEVAREEQTFLSNLRKQVEERQAHD